jgi:ABC-type dipeptide/oligopeptide/nickel transport system permease component
MARTATADRIAGAFVLVVLAGCCLVFWIGIPLAVLWGLSKATDDAATHFVSGLLGVPLAMAAFSPVLFWLNHLYLRITGVLDRLAEDEEESGWQRRVRGPLEPMMLVSLVVAIVALFVWFFFFAEDPPRQVI